MMPENLKKYNKAIAAFVTALIPILVYFLGPDNEVVTFITGLLVLLGIPLGVAASPKNKPQEPQSHPKPYEPPK